MVAEITQRATMSIIMTTIKQVARKGGKARWANVDKEARSEAMKRVRRGLSTVAPQDTLDKQARQE